MRWRNVLKYGLEKWYGPEKICDLKGRGVLFVDIYVTKLMVIS